MICACVLNDARIIQMNGNENTITISQAATVIAGPVRFVCSIYCTPKRLRIHINMIVRPRTIEKNITSSADAIPSLKYWKP